MGCLNAGQGFEHWFGNVHLSGPCNRSCYWCIGQFLQAQDGFNTLGEFPLKNWEPYVEACRAHHVNTIYLTGTNTDPLLYQHYVKFVDAVHTAGFQVGIRTNGVTNLHRLGHFDTASVSVCSVDPAINRTVMGGEPPDVLRVLALAPNDLKVNVVLCPEICADNYHDLFKTLYYLINVGVHRINLREPYGQPHQGNPMVTFLTTFGDGRCPVEMQRLDDRYGMPRYRIGATEILYWDVHYVGVESVNLYTGDGRISIEYPITKGCVEGGIVQPQSEFPLAGRKYEQWL